AALAGTGLAAHYAAQHAARQMASAFEAGRVFGAWVLAAHRASQEQDFAARLSVQRSFVLTPAELRGFGAVPPGLPERASRDGETPRYAAFAVGIMDDGRGQAGLPPVAMAFGVLEPARAEAAATLRSGAIAAGLAALAEAGSTDTVMAAHVPAIEGALGRSLAPDGLYVTADAGLRYADAVLYRRAQPGRPGLNRMETALNAGGNDVTGIADADGFTASVSGDAEVTGSGSVAGDASAARLEAGSLEAGSLAAASLTVSAELLVGRAVAGPVSAGSADVGGRLEAASVTAAGALTADTLAVAGTTSVSGRSSAQSLAGEMLTASGTMRAGRISSTGLHGPDASIGTLNVGSCGGCLRCGQLSPVISCGARVPAWAGAQQGDGAFVSVAD
ncbi:MAG: hypothetical protein OXC15_19810, partial [Rhodospirillaceae bacterium]|nr:hypothetical protein [Rhodospirillaceae bacterium]